jgi:hypothetical protein
VTLNTFWDTILLGIGLLLLELFGFAAWILITKPQVFFGWFNWNTVLGVAEGLLKGALATLVWLIAIGMTLAAFAILSSH